MGQDSAVRKRHKEASQKASSPRNDVDKTSHNVAAKTSHNNDVLSTKNDKVKDIVDANGDDLLHQKIKEKLADTYSRPGVSWTRRCYDTQQNDIQHNDTQHNHTQHNSKSNGISQHNGTQHYNKPSLC